MNKNIMGKRQKAQDQVSRDKDASRHGAQIH